jgi:hypothetical protein
VSEASTIKRVARFARHSMPISAQKTLPTAEAGIKEGHYKPLPKDFRRDGFTYREITREKDAAIYEQRWTGCPEAAVCFEVIRIRRRDGFHIGGRFVQPAEVYPNSEAWGVDAFTFSERNKARAKFSEISLEEPAKRGKEVNLKWENHSGSSSATLST